jgi:hypothetical protein
MTVIGEVVACMDENRREGTAMHDLMTFLDLIATALSWFNHLWERLQPFWFPMFLGAMLPFIIGGLCSLAMTAEGVLSTRDDLRRVTEKLDKVDEGLVKINERLDRLMDLSKTVSPRSSTRNSDRMT